MTTMIISSDLKRFLCERVNGSNFYPQKGTARKKKLRVKGTLSHFSPTRFRTRIFVCFTTRILGFFSLVIFWYQSLTKQPTPQAKLNPATSRAWFDYVCEAGQNRATCKRPWTRPPGTTVHRFFLVSYLFLLDPYRLYLHLLWNWCLFQPELLRLFCRVNRL